MRLRAARKERGSGYTKLLWQCANPPLPLLDLTIFYSFSSITLILILSPLFYLSFSLYRRFNTLLYCSSIHPNIAAFSFGFYASVVQPSVSRSCCIACLLCGKSDLGCCLKDQCDCQVTQIILGIYVKLFLFHNV